METEAIFIFSLILLAMVETYFAGRWYPFFYRSGVPVYQKTHQFHTVTASKLDIDKLSTEFDSAWGPSLLFHEIGTGEFAFREAIFQFRLLTYTPLMHGHILIQPEKGMVTVTGRLYWMIVLVVAYLVATLPMEWLLQSLLFLAAVLAVLYYIQARRFNRVTVFVRGELSAKQSA